ncbi:class IV adenylate cyclase, partial [Patescibacteria group bacterium]|nr:class IV adenylate cyclase [Patescibacteria group bacterium]
MQKEIEIKAKISSIPEIRKKLKKIGAKKVSSKMEVDIYYTPERGEKYIGKGSRLKFRIRYDGKSNRGRLEVHKVIGLLEAVEYELPIEDVELAQKMLKQLKFIECAVVDKKRESYKFGKLNIVLDKVKSLGKFMEIEIMNADSKKALTE